MKIGLGIVMGVVILLADLYWIHIAMTPAVTYGYATSSSSTPLILGAIILVADLVWLALEFKGGKK